MAELDAEQLSDEAAELHARAIAALEVNQLDRAQRLAAEARTRFVQAWGEVHPDVANCDVLAARAAQAASAYAQALARIERAVATLEAARDAYPDEPVVVEQLAEASALHAAVLISLGRYRDADQAARATLALAEAALGPDAEAVASLCNALGMCAKYLARWDDGAAWYARAVVILTARHGADAPALASLEHNLGGLAHARGEPALAEPHARRAVELRERAVGPTHPEVAADLAAWAAVLDELGRTAEAEAAYRRALAIFTAAYGREHYEVGFTRGALGALYAARERWGDAHRELVDALAIQHALLGDAHPDVALLHHYLAVVEHGRGDGVAAAAHAAHARAGFERCFDADHPRVQDAIAVQRAIADAGPTR